jgi:hypothetical protein
MNSVMIGAPDATTATPANAAANSARALRWPPTSGQQLREGDRGKSARMQFGVLVHQSRRHPATDASAAVPQERKRGLKLEKR